MEEQDFVATHKQRSGVTGISSSVLYFSWNTLPFLVCFKFLHWFSRNGLRLLSEGECREVKQNDIYIKENVEQYTFCGFIVFIHLSYNYTSVQVLYPVRSQSQRQKVIRLSTILLFWIVVNGGLLKSASWVSILEVFISKWNIEKVSLFLLLYARVYILVPHKVSHFFFPVFMHILILNLIS